MAQKVILFLMMIGFSSNSPRTDDLFVNLCTTKECFATGFSINQTIQTETDPCENFYQFSCGDYKAKTRKPKHEIFWNHWISTEHILKERLNYIIERKRDVNLKDVRRFYESCLKTNEYTKDLILLLEIFGNWPIIDEKWKEKGFNWLFLTAELSKLFKINAVLKISVQIDYKNTTKYAVYLSPPNLILPKYILLNPILHVNELLAYKKWIFDTIAYMYPNKIAQNLDVDIDEIVQLEIKLAKLSQTGHNRQRSILLKDLSYTSKQNWTEAINVAFSETNIRLSEDDHIYHTDYVINLLKLVKGTKKSTMANYLIWFLIKELSRDTSDVMRKLNFEIDRAVLGVASDVPRREECIAKLTEYMGPILMHEYSKDYLRAEDIIKVNRMAENIRTNFVKVLRRNKWLSTTAKRLVIEKILAVKFHIGHSDWINDWEYVHNTYRNLTITSNYFANILELRRLSATQNLQKLTSIVRTEWPENLFDVNAYYNVLQNSILITVGLLKPPFFHRDRPSVFNYAALGTLIGHELAHALDTTGRKADRNGNIKKRWTVADVKTYNKRVECFEKHYKKYKGYTEATMGENIADIIGVQLSFGAYTISKKVSGIVPFLETFTDDQMFFVTYAQLWCEIMQNEDVLRGDEHSSVEVRVIEAVRSNKNFEKVFRCKATTSRTCTFW